MPLAERLGALQERDFRLLFAGDDDHDGRRPARRDRARLRRARHRLGHRRSGSSSPSGRASRRSSSLGGGVLSDRLPRNLVLVGASLVQGVAQAATAAVVLAGAGGVGAIVALQAVYGVGLGPRAPGRGRSRARRP